ncbi:hypothetical protein KDL44_08680 [bacterium]|nr:hypothetical protein [bacterium]
MNKMYLACLALLALVCVSCGGGSAALDNSRQPTPAQPMDVDQLSSGLPSFEDLAGDSSRDLSIAGPGWYTLDLEYRNFGGAEQGVSEDLPAIDIAGSGSNGFCVFGVHGFDGDGYPTSLRADVSNVVGEYYLLHTNYVDGRWISAGPFTESVTHEYPEVSEYTDPEILASARHNHYVAILVPDGSSLQLDMLQLGVAGGSEGPFQVLTVVNTSNEDLVSIQWMHSASFNEPDFAGYSVERAPFPVGEFTNVSTENTFEAAFNDPQPALDEKYMYRVRSWDTAGNSAVSMAVLGWRQLGYLSPPVCVVDMPRGPLNGPVEVSFDLSGSYDNDGDAVTDYYFDFGPGIGEITQPDPVYTTTLQPGCYFINFAVKAGGFNGSTSRMLKVYPQWEQASQLIDAGTPLTLRYGQPRSFFDSASGKVVFLFSDAATPSIVSLAVDSAGNVDRFDLPVVFDEPVALLSEPVFVDGQWLFTLAYQDQYIICGWHDNEITPNYLIQGPSTDSYKTCMVTDGNGNIWVLYHDFNVGYDITVRDMQTLTDTVIVPGLIADGSMDAEWNADAGAIDLVYSGSGATGWLRWSPVIGPMGSDVLSGADSEFIDVEQDPATGRPTALFSDGPSVRFADLNDDDATWTAPLPVDPVDPDWAPTRLLYRDGNSYCYVGDNPGAAKLYRRNGAAWDAINTADFADGGFASSMAYNPAVPGFTVIDTALDFATRITQMQEDGSEQEYYISDGWARSGLDMSAVSSGTDIHLLHRPLFSYTHWTSPDGDSWTETTNAGAADRGQIVVDENGEIYSGIAGGGTSVLQHWVDPLWVMEDTHTLSIDSEPLVYGQGNVMLFGNFDKLAVPSEFNYKEGLDPTKTSTPAVADIWGGAFAGIDAGSYSIMVLFGGADIEDSSIGILHPGNNTISEVYSSSFNRFADDWTVGRHYEGSSYMHAFAGSRDAFYVSYGPNNTYARLQRTPFNDWEVHNFGFSVSVIEIYERRNCVSAMTARGNTAVGIGSGALGDVGFFEWSNFGNWESLPVPEGMENGSLHELVTGPDGRWHIIYRDYVNDDLRIISTIE